MENNRIIWLNGKIVNINEANINVLSPSFQFGLNVFEGIRCYWNDQKKTLYCFRLEDHFDRLINSAKLIKINSKYTKEEFRKYLIETLKASNYKEDIAVRQTVFVNGFGSWFSKDDIGMFIAPIAKGRTLAKNQLGLSAMISTYKRISENNMSPKIKVGANYINSRMAQLEATDNGYDTTILLNEFGKVSEGPGSCIFIIKNNKLYTPSLSESILDSITRDTVFEIAKYLKVEYIEKIIDRTELYIADEVFLCGSAMEIVPITKIDNFKIGSNFYPLTNKIFDTYLKITRGELLLKKEWITNVYE